MEIGAGWVVTAAILATASAGGAGWGLLEMLANGDVRRDIVNWAIVSILAVNAAVCVRFVVLGI